MNGSVTISTCVFTCLQPLFDYRFHGGGNMASFSTKSPLPRRRARTQQVALSWGLNKRGQMLAAGERAESDTLGWAKQQGTQRKTQKRKAGGSTDYDNMLQQIDLKKHHYPAECQFKCMGKNDLQYFFQFKISKQSYDTTWKQAEVPFLHVGRPEIRGLCSSPNPTTIH